MTFTTGLSGETIEAQSRLGFAELDAGETAAMSLFDAELELGPAGAQAAVDAEKERIDFEFGIIRQPPIPSNSAGFGFSSGRG